MLSLLLAPVRKSQCNLQDEGPITGDSSVGALRQHLESRRSVMDHQDMDLPEAPWLSNVTFTADPCSLCDRQFKHHTRSRTAIEMRLVNHDQRTLQCVGNRERKFCVLVMSTSNKLRAEHTRHWYQLQIHLH